VIRVWCGWIAHPHDKFCICICPHRRWFMFINSEPPAFRKARELALELDAAAALFLTHTSYIDTTHMLVIEQDILDAALSEEGRCHGKVSPTLRTWIQGAVGAHEVMPEDQRIAVLTD